MSAGWAVAVVEAGSGHAFAEAAFLMIPHPHSITLRATLRIVGPGHSQCPVLNE